MRVPPLDKSLLARIHNNRDHQHTDQLDLLLHIALTLDALLEALAPEPNSAPQQSLTEATTAS